MTAGNASQLYTKAAEIHNMPEGLQQDMLKFCCEFYRSV